MVQNCVVFGFKLGVLFNIQLAVLFVSARSELCLV